MARLNDALRAFDEGDERRALRLLWDEKTEAAGLRDRGRLVLLVGAVERLGERAGRRGEFDRLAGSIRAELGALGGAASPLEGRLADVERRLDALRTEVVELRRLASGHAHGEDEPEPEPERVAEALPVEVPASVAA